MALLAPAFVYAPASAGRTAAARGAASAAAPRSSRVAAEPRPTPDSAALLTCLSGGALAVGCAVRRRTQRRVQLRPRAANQTRVARRATELTERQEQFWEMLEEDLNDDVVPEFGKTALARVYEFIKYCKGEIDIPPLPMGQEIDPEYFPGLRAQPWWDPEVCGEWIEKVQEGLPYVQGELADLLEEDEAKLISDSVQNNVMGGGWSGFRLQRLGDWLPKNCEQFPQTVQLLKEAGAPLAMRGVIVARQAPGSGVAPHSDGRNFFLTAHFGLSVPEDCDMTAGGVTKEWEEDGCIILDTSFVHSTRNDSEEDRFVLIVDFWHPDLTEAEREALEYIYDFRTKFEQGKIKYIPKMPTGFFETLNMYSAWGGAYTEEKTEKRESTQDDNLGGFRLGGR